MSDPKPDYPPIRRIVTGHDDRHVARVMIDGAAANAKYPAPGTVSTLIWSTHAAPAENSVGTEFEDLGAKVFEDSGEVHRGSSSHTGSVLALTQVTANTTNGELQTSLGRCRSGLLLSATSLSFSCCCW